jgi:NAD(P)-dependent dehydrogenase (short-subunit alcohol dehydrogenase family)
LKFALTIFHFTFMERSVWFVTGASMGFGLCTVKYLLAHGLKVAATTRSVARLLENVGAHDEASLLPLEVDIQSDESIKAGIEKTIAKFGHLDVLVNNAGCGQTGPVEENSREEVEYQFRVNFFSAQSFIRHVLPHFRARKNGFIMNISSIAEFTPGTGLGIYAASKAALTAMTESLRGEVADLGIRATSVCPGPFDTNFFSVMKGPEGKIADYAKVHQRLKEFAESEKHGDPEKAAAFFVELANNPNPPPRVFIGSFAVERAVEKVALIGKELEEWKARGNACDKS